jgi:hypothetical protein
LGDTEAQKIYYEFDALIDKCEAASLNDSRFKAVAEQLRYMRDRLPEGTVKICIADEHGNGSVYLVTSEEYEAVLSGEIEVGDLIEEEHCLAHLEHVFTR